MELQEYMGTLIKGLDSTEVRSDEKDTCSFTIKLPNERKQTLYARRFEEEGMVMIRLYTFIDSRARFSDKKLIEALELNSSLRFGACALYEEKLALVDTFSSAHIKADIVTAAVKYLAQTADTYEQMMTGLDRQ